MSLSTVTKKACKHLQKCLSRRKKIKIFNADIDNDVYVDGVFQNENIGAIIHCAADISVPESVENPLKYYYNNTSKSIKLLEKAKRNGVNNFVFPAPLRSMESHQKMSPDRFQRHSLADQSMPTANPS